MIICLEKFDFDCLKFFQVNIRALRAPSRLCIYISELISSWYNTICMIHGNGQCRELETMINYYYSTCFFTFSVVPNSLKCSGTFLIY